MSVQIVMDVFLWYYTSIWQAVISKRLPAVWNLKPLSMNFLYFAIQNPWVCISHRMNLLHAAWFSNSTHCSFRKHWSTKLYWSSKYWLNSLHNHIQYHYKSYQQSKQWEALQLMTADMFSKIVLFALKLSFNQWK